MVRTVQGFRVSNFAGKKNEVKVVLQADKDDINAGPNGIIGLLESLEIHSTASDSSTIGVSLRNSSSAETLTSYEFSVVNFAVKQDTVKIVVSADTEEVGVSVLSALGIHTAEEENVEIRMQTPE